MSSGFIDLIDVALMCGLDIKQSTLNRQEVQARCPYCQDHAYRMYLSHDPANPTFWCHNCSTGGNAVTLYADWNPMGKRLSTRDAYRILTNNPTIHSYHLNYEETRPRPFRIRPIEERSVIYLELLKLLKLEPKHRDNLMQRGLSEEMIEGNMYRSFPLDLDYRIFVEKTMERLYNLQDMPGFFTKNLRWRMAGKQSGIMTPVCDVHNRIQGIQIRLDEPPPKIITLEDGNKVEKKGQRFRWFSSSGYENGTSIHNYIHIAGDTSSKILHITEGVIKADVASYLSGGALFAGLIGVQNIRYLPEVISILRPKEIVECIDMDLRTNPEVQKSQSRIQAMCMPLADHYRMFYWPSEQKGIDDYLLFQKLKQEQKKSA